jgi:tRNA (mo5U34)-methyltransferase
MVDEHRATALQKEVDAVPYWWHSIDLGHGVVTPGGTGDTSELLQRLALPDDLTGKTVLDIGAWDGFYSFECERRGAARVVASDLFAWRQMGWDGKAGFEVARRALGSHVEDVEIDVFDISPETVGTFDIVLFLGVLYHLRDPFRGLAHAASVTRELLIIETHVDLLDVERPAMAIYPGEELAGDETNWSGPNVPALTGMLGSMGLDAELLSLEPQIGDEEWLRATGTGSGTQGSRRAVVHGRPHPSGHQPGSAEAPRRATAAATDHGIEVIELRRRLAAIESQLSAARELIAVLQNMKVVRWTAWPRRLVYRLRARRS